MTRVRNPAFDELFRQALERADLAQISGVMRGKRGPCPICQHKPKHGKDTALQHFRDGRWWCFRCELGGDAIDLVCALQSLDSKADAARFILGLPLDGSGDRALTPATGARLAWRERQDEGRKRTEARSQEARDAYHARVMAELDEPGNWAPAIGSQRIGAWLASARGLPLDLITDALCVLHSVPRAHYFEDFRAREIERRPAMVADIECPFTGEIIGRHVTYLSLDGRAKAGVDAPRKIWGSARGGVWLTERDPARGPLFVAEGIETCLSMLAAWRAEHGVASGRALAVLSLGNLQGSVMTDRFGRIDAAFPRPDKPAMCWARCGRVIIGADHDMKPLKVKVRKPGGGTEHRELSSTERMEICGRLASYWWRLAGADPVTVARPPEGMDFNDQFRAEAVG